ncbi:MAG: type I DNA topoisomerase [Clostridia bacterium]|nr:type I DNA topoisomerase [Clostridia bacterium]
MAKTLVIVESEHKAKIIQGFLGSDYEVRATVGHIRDLPKTLLGVDIQNRFKPHYVDIAGKSQLIRGLRERAAALGDVILATDPDREGEAISWHLATLLGTDLAAANRVTFNEITKSGVAQGMSKPRKIDMDLVNAQQARRVLDRIVGYQISPYLWKKVRKGLSAGRVQSATAALVVDREQEIRGFKVEEYWSVDAKLSASKTGKKFPAKLALKNGSKVKIRNKDEADRILADLENAEYRIASVKRGTRHVNPAPPFTTSTLQQEASRRLGFETRQTMRVAQELYEGVNVAGIGAVGLITYLRTDSLRISDEARREGNAYIEANYGKEYLPEKARHYKTRAGAQDAHEAIRPTMPNLTPAQAKGSLSSDQYKLYRLIWERFIASLMQQATHETCQADIAAGEYTFKASGYSVKFDGYTVLYTEGKDEEDEENAPLPKLEQDMVLTLRDLAGNQHFTQPPARYTEATLVKAMEESGIGRPSTYAPTIGTILSREYIEREGKSLKPTALGEIITQVMKENFPEVVDIKFTAHMEEQLDEVEHGNNDWINMMDTFYQGFSKTLAAAEKNITDERVKVPDVESDEVCEQCGRKMVIKSGRYGKFLACPGYPTCKNTKRIVVRTGGTCPKCGGDILSKKSRNNRKFFGCSNYPNCDFVSWNEPSKETCPNCGKTLFKQKGKDAKLFCMTDGCGYTKAPEKRKKATEE